MAGAGGWGTVSMTGHLCPGKGKGHTRTQAHISRDPCGFSSRLQQVSGAELAWTLSPKRD